MTHDRGHTLCSQIGLSKARQREVPSRASARRNPLNVVDPVAREHCGNFAGISRARLCFVVPNCNGTTWLSC
jgi:hypothetical protein